MEATDDVIIYPTEVGNIVVRVDRSMRPGEFRTETPPPAAHPERRPGQRWRVWEGKCAIDVLLGARFEEDGYVFFEVEHPEFEDCIRDSFYMARPEAILLQDAPASAEIGGIGYALIAKCGRRIVATACWATEELAKVNAEFMLREHESVCDECQPAQPKPCCRVAGLSGGRSHYSDCKRAVVTVPQGGSITTPWISLKPAKTKVAAKVEPVPLNQCDEACGRTGPLRYLTNRLRRLCDPCYLSLEKDQARRMAFYVVPAIDAIRNAPPKPGPLPVCEDLWTLLGEDVR